MRSDGNTAYTDEQLQAAKRLCDAILAFLRDFYLPDGLTGSLWEHYRTIYPGLFSRAIEDAIVESAEKRAWEVEFVYRQEAFYLRGTEIYEVLGTCIEEEVYAALQDKLSYEYRYTQDPESEFPRFWTDYAKALNRVNEILQSAAKQSVQNSSSPTDAIG